jgi:hypothetical protein
MNLTRYNPNLDRGITTQPNVSGLRCFDGEDLRKLTCEKSLMYMYSKGAESEAAATTAEGVDLTVD